MSDGARQAPSKAAEIKSIHKRIAELAVMIDRAATLSLSIEDPAPYQRKIELLERERRAAVQRQAELKDAEATAEATRAIGAPEMKALMAEFAESIRQAPRDRVKLLLRQCLQKVVLDPDTFEAEIHFAVPTEMAEINPASVALLPGFEPGFKP